MIVIGSGPVGNYVAFKMAGMGYKVAVLEQHKPLRKQICCTGIISQDCIRSFAVNKSIVLRQINRARIISPSGNLLRLWREETQACVIDRAAFDQMKLAGLRVRVQNINSIVWLHI